MLDLDNLSADLATALAHGDLYALYQPQIDLRGEQICAVEALCRWRRADGEAVGPDVFIPAAERSGIIHDLGRFMLDECLAMHDRFVATGRAIDVSVNVSSMQLTRSSFVDYLIAQAAKRSPGAPTMTIEITESMPVSDMSVIVPRLEEVRALGVGVSLDDFGTGHASLAQMQLLPLTEVKLDRSLIQSASRKAGRALREGVERARDRGLRIVAEGVETEEHLAYARDLGCDRAQGYLFAAPMSTSDVEAL
ncbi:EAL domain-containing protein [Microbacterium rhizomatis]|uniref:EAL domain-containing protein n=1 Tax=Microbacterium rhizomatis TaxID=1631477 RepID=A0A5J5IW31_9MICO|nr:EAL domain-containing protein [Microbacterium rhizomatis]KAA9104979.1 EAL domain-containing protein [Microbacterium rhizomatis]